jgi:hypothetical protein
MQEGGNAECRSRRCSCLLFPASLREIESSVYSGLARDYGSFMLRNALAISLALDIEDGELGF